MKFIETKFKGSFLLEPEKRVDERGFFARIFCEKEFKEYQLNTTWVQNNTSFNIKKATIRGLHYQDYPHPEIKLVRCTKGSIFDVIVDIRKNSSTYLQYFSVELSQYNNISLYIPEGFALK